MRAAAIFGLGSSTKDLQPFQKDARAEWFVGLPVSQSEADAVLVFGGDGTVHRHLGALVKLDLPVLVVPRGSGNDFARALGLRRVRDSRAAWRRFASGGGNVRAIDLGIITPVTQGEPQGPKSGTPIGTPEQAAENLSFLNQDVTLANVIPSTGAVQPGEGSGVKRQGSGAESSGSTRQIPRAAGENAALRDDSPFPYPGNWKPETADSRYFCCVAGVGLDAEVARRANTLPRWLRGHGGYALSLPPALMRFASQPMRVSVLDCGRFVLRSAKPTVLAAFANAPTYGGGMKIAPRASLGDGQLDICVITDINRLKLLRLFPTVYFGRHLGMDGVDYFQAGRLRLETEHPLDVYADGEFVCHTPVEVAVVPQALRVIVHPSQTGF